MSPRLKRASVRPTHSDERWMGLALNAAEKSSRARTRPNPQVACLLVKNNRIIAQAVHARFGGPHAEALALQKAGTKARGATAYVTLEPCGHTDKKTPPCTRALIDAGVRRVFIACRDQNPQVNGKGVAQLRAAGIEVVEGAFQDRAETFYRFFFHWIRTGRPWVTLKMACSLDGKITAPARYLSNPSALKEVQRLRASHDAILVGHRTVRSDNPRLTVRSVSKREQPLRVILDSRLQLNPRLRIFHNGPVLVACMPDAPQTKIRRFEKAGIDVWTCPKNRRGRVKLEELLDELGRRGIRSVLVEGGSRVATALLQEKQVDEALFFVTPWLSGPNAPSLYAGTPLHLKDAVIHVLDDNAVFRVRFPKTVRTRR